jgi:hypothetical protein
MSESITQVDTSHFDAAKKIVETLTGLDPASQSRAMRFASETLGLQNAPVFGLTPTLPSASAPGTLHSTDIKQFVANKAPKSDLQFAAVVAYFYRFEAPEAARKDQINAESLQEASRLAGRERLKKPYFTLNNAKNAGYLDAGGDGYFSINAVGANLVAMTLPGNGSQVSPKRKAGSKKAKSRKAVSRKGSQVRRD